MKKALYGFVSVLVLAGMTSCKNWLDVNTDPDNPNNESALVDNRLTWVEKFIMYSMGIANYRTSAYAGVYYSTYSTVSPNVVTNDFANGLTTSAYQTWFVEAAANLRDLYNKAEAEEAYHYMACTNVLHAMGFMEMLDLYGEMPYTEALAESPSPAYDDGKTIFNGCIAKLDEAIELFSRTQGTAATPLASGDFWLGGDTSKWVKLCYGLKARYLLRLSKKSDLFDMTEILSCLEKAPQSVSDNVFATCYNVDGETEDWLYFDPISTNSNWDVVAYGTTQRYNKFYGDLLVNMRGAGVEDPRYTKIVPAIMTNIKLGSNGEVASNDWKRSEFVDVYGDAERLLAGGARSIAQATFAAAPQSLKYEIKDASAKSKFVSDMGPKVVSVQGDTVEVLYHKGAIYINNSNYIYAGDTVYVSLRSDGTLTRGLSPTDMNWHFGTVGAESAKAVGSTGSFQTRPNSDFEILTYHEMCFIKAEVMFRQGNTSGAFEAYKAGIKAHIDMMQAKLQDWTAGGYADTNPDMKPMDEAQITRYMSSGAVCQSASDLTMKDIMLQKYVAMGCSIENWNDMRRFNFSAGNVGNFGVIYEGFERSPLWAGASKLPGTSKTDPQYWMRRWRLPGTLELSYNAANAEVSNKHAYSNDIWSIPVWWDCATDDEYYGYIR